MLTYEVNGEENKYISTITSLGSSDSGSTSRTTINTNFTNLNTDKYQSGATPTFDKTIISSGTPITGANAHFTIQALAASLYGAKFSLDASQISGGVQWDILSSSTAAGEGAGNLTFEVDGGATALTLNSNGNATLGGNLTVGASGTGTISAGGITTTGNIKSGGYLSASNNAGVNTTVTTAGLVGKTMTFENGLLVDFS